MTRWRAFKQLILARIREFYREPEVIFWVYGFPILLAVALAFAFKGGEPQTPPVDVQSGEDAALAEKIVEALREVKFEVGVYDAKTCMDRLVKGKTALLIIPTSEEIIYKYDKTRAESFQARQWADSVLARHDLKQLRKQSDLAARLPTVDDKYIEEPGSRYIDWLLPGLLGMNLMGGGLFGVGFVLVDMRVRKLFKRLLATPMNRGDFLLALMTTRLLFLLPEMAALLGLGLVLGVPMNGSYFTLFVVILLGAYAFSGLGLLLGCRTEKTEAMSGYMNLVMLPSYLLSGVFFSSKRFPETIQPVIQALPLTQINDALREVMLEGAGFDKTWHRLLILLAWGMVCFTLALRWFRWR